MQLVGLYKNSDYSVDETTCYVNHKTMHDIVLNKYKDELEEYELQKNNGYMLTVDSAEHINNVKRQLDELNYYYQDASYIETQYINNVFNHINFIVYAVILFTFLFIFFIFKKDFKEDKDYYSLLNKLGFNKKQIRLSYLITIILKSLIYFVFAIIMYALMCIILKIILLYFPYLFVKY